MYYTVFGVNLELHDAAGCKNVPVGPQRRLALVRLVSLVRLMGSDLHMLGPRRNVPEPPKRLGGEGNLPVLDIQMHGVTGLTTTCHRRDLRVKLV